MTLKKKNYAKSGNQISKPATVIINLLFIGCVVICLYPLLLVVGISFTDNDALREGYRLIPRVFSTDGYRFAVTTGGAIVRAYGVTVFVTVVGTFCHLTLCSLFAYPLSRPEFAYRKVFTVFILIPMLFSGGLVPWYVVCTQVLHLKDTIFALFVPSLFSTWNVIVLRTFIKNNIHDSLIESARLDGSSEFQTWFFLVLPLSKAGLATIGFMVALGFWNDWWLPLMLINDVKLINLQYMLYRIMSQIQFLQNLSSLNVAGGSIANQVAMTIPQETARMAMCVLTIGPIIFVYPFFQRYFVKGLTIGAIKG
jgi:putative aldouronate transport system permease protein